jgi:hypothetical protein
MNGCGGNRDEAADFVRASAGKLKPGDPLVTGLYRNPARPRSPTGQSAAKAKMVRWRQFAAPAI